jgi:hypothetical protein
LASARSNPIKRRARPSAKAIIRFGDSIVLQAFSVAIAAISFVPVPDFLLYATRSGEAQGIIRTGGHLLKILMSAIAVFFIVAHGIALRDMHARTPVDFARPGNSVTNGD